LEPFAGKSVYFDSYILDVEAAGLGEQLSGALAKANIKSEASGLRKRIPAGRLLRGFSFRAKTKSLPRHC
jgi:hypothetical protein